MNVLKKLFVPKLIEPYHLIRNAHISQIRNVGHIAKAMPPLEEEGREHREKSKWLAHNDKIYPPQSPDEERRPAFVCHAKKNIKYSPKKMWYIACFVRGMSVDEALIQLNYVPKKGVLAVREAILEAQQLAVDNHNVEYKSNLWIAESFVGKGHFIIGHRRHAKSRFGEVEYKYCHYYIRLEEGKPPANYYNKPIMDKDMLLSKWIEQMRSRKIISSL